MSMNVSLCSEDHERFIIGYTTGTSTHSRHVVAIMHCDEFHDLFGKDAYDRVRAVGAATFEVTLTECDERAPHHPPAVKLPAAIQ